MSEEQKSQDEVKEEVVQAGAEQKQEERPEANYKAELERKNREIERMRQELSARNEQPRQRDPNDMRTWTDQELKAVLTNPQPEALPYKDQANEILLDRKVDARLAKKEETNKRVSAEMELRSKFPEALDPSSVLAVRMEQILHENDLSRTPAGRLVAAKLAASELNQGKNTSEAIARKAEKDRVASVRSNMVDGDRAKPTETNQNLENKRKELESKLTSGKDAQQVEAVGEILKDRFGSRDGFFSGPRYTGRKE